MTLSALGRIGGFVADNAMVYGELGGGVAAARAFMQSAQASKWRWPSSSACAVTCRVSDVFGGTPSVAKATVGLLWHIN